MKDRKMTPQNFHTALHRWPEGAIVYHIYPRSLQDSNSDGIGDLPGIIQRLDYLQDLGVTAIWLSPFYPSPMADFGYDVADYCAVHPMFGTLDDFKKLLDEAQRRDIKVIIDLVPNHTSDEHEWFKQSQASRDGKYSNWYVWKDPKLAPGDGGTLLPPNNWLDALTGGPAWKWNDHRKQFYLHSFDVRQPDLNWSNTEVREAMKDVMRFWLDLGVDGFRVDAVYWMAKDPLYRDDSVNQDYAEGEDPHYESLAHDNSRGWPAVYAYLAEMARVLKEKKYQHKQRFMVTEAYPERHNPLADYLAFYVSMDPEVAAPFNFEGVSLAWEAGNWRRFLRTFQGALQDLSLHCVASYAFGNHDQSRLASRLGDAAARSSAVMLLTLPGMAFIYYGEEIGMKDVDIPPEYVHDPAAKDDHVKGQGRDPERTPMQWSAGKHAGFSEATDTWLPLAPDYKTRNVEVQSADPHSSLSLYRQLANLRNSSDAMKYGLLEVLDLDRPDVLGYLRSQDDERYAVFINFSAEPQSCHPGVVLGEFIVSSDPATKLTDAHGEVLELLPHEGVLFSLPA